jgi:hypothetical protein
MQKDIDFLEKLADVECGCMEDDDHDCDNCVYCEARRVLNEIGEIAWHGVKSAQQKLHLTPESLATSHAFVNASALKQSDGDTPPAQAQVS